MEGQESKGEARERKPSLGERVKRFVENDRKKIGGMTFGASARLGLAELREAFNLGGNIVQPTPYGMYGTLTPGEVYTARKSDSEAQRMEEGARDAKGKAQGTVHGKKPRGGTAHGGENRRTRPSDIARDNSVEGHDQDRGREQDRKRGRGH